MSSDYDWRRDLRWTLGGTDCSAHERVEASDRLAAHIERLEAERPIPFGTITLDDSEVEALAQDRDRWMHRAQQLLAERHACPGCNHLATLLVNEDACPRKGHDLFDGYFLECGCMDDGVPRICADEDTADCVARIVAWEEER